MSSPMLIFGILFIWFSCQVNAVVFQQSPPQIVKQGTEVQINCRHDDTSLVIMLWYQQREDSMSITLIGYGYANSDQNYEGQFDKEFELTREDTVTGALVVRKAKVSDSAVYFCAAGTGTGGYEAFFGGGTKLTVLDPELTVTRPTVKVLQPSAKECKNSRGNAEKTIVCLATGFYPDHVSVSWQVGGVDTIPGVATDNAALQGEDKYYTITSRLRVSAKEWYDPNTEFKCTVSFFNGTDTKSYSDSISGEEAKEGVLTREKYLKITQTAKLSYGVFIVKSMVYGVFVAFLVWKLQNSSGKRNH